MAVENNIVKMKWYLINLNRVKLMKKGHFSCALSLRVNGAAVNGTKLRLLAWSFDRLATLTATLLTTRDVDRAQLATTITRMDAGVEPPWTVSRRVVVNCARFMSRTHANMA